MVPPNTKEAAKIGVTFFGGILFILLNCIMNKMTKACKRF